MKLGVFISGTDTGVGKTIVSSLIVSSLKAFGIRRGYFKPLQTGQDSDTEMVSKLTGIPMMDLPRPTYEYPEPVAPYRAAFQRAEQIQLDRIQRDWERLDHRAWVVEGAGGLLVPLNLKQTIRDLVASLKLRMILVASTRLGTINHTLLSVEAARAKGISIAGIVLVGEEDPGLDTTLMDLTEVPIIARVPKYPEISEVLIQEEGPKVFPVTTLKFLYD